MPAELRIMSVKHSLNPILIFFCQLSSIGFLGFVLSVVNAAINVANNLNSNNNNRNNNNNQNNDNNANINIANLNSMQMNMNMALAPGRKLNKRSTPGNR
jgi:hypothetical protein